MLRACSRREVAPYFFVSALTAHVSRAPAIVAVMMVQAMMPTAIPTPRAPIHAIVVIVIVVCQHRRGKRDARDEHCDPPTLHSYLLAIPSAPQGTDCGQTRRS
jgi:hypothetical protein